MGDRSIIPKVVNGKVVITNKNDYDEIRLSMEDMERALNNCYQRGRADTINEVLKALNNKSVEISFDLPIEEILGEDVNIDDFSMLLEDAIMAYRKMAIGTIEMLGKSK